MTTLTEVQRLVDVAQQAINASDLDRARIVWPQIKKAIYNLDLTPSVQAGLRRSIHARLDSLQLSSPSPPIDVYSLLKENAKIEIPSKSPNWLPY